MKLEFIATMQHLILANKDTCTKENVGFILIIFNLQDFEF